MNVNFYHYWMSAVRQIARQAQAQDAGGREGFISDAVEESEYTRTIQGRHVVLMDYDQDNMEEARQTMEDDVRFAIAAEALVILPLPHEHHFGSGCDSDRVYLCKSVPKENHIPQDAVLLTHALAEELGGVVRIRKANEFVTIYGAILPASALGEFTHVVNSWCNTMGDRMGCDQYPIEDIVKEGRI